MRNRIKGRKASLLIGLLVLIAGAGALRVTWADLIVWYRLRPDFALHRWRNGQGCPEYRHRRTGIIFVYLPGGTFRMGNAPQEESPGDVTPALHPAVRRSLSQAVVASGTDDAGPQHLVSLSPFLVAKYEVSQAEWQRIMGTDRSHYDAGDRPVENVSWLDCREFCKMTSLELPTEAQWEYACRAGTTTLYAFGDTISTAQVNFDEDVFDDVEGATIWVDAGPPNGFGLHNVHGNVWEWSEDDYDPRFYSQPEASDLDPVCSDAPSPNMEARHVVRGGSWANNARECRSAKRAWSRPDERDSYTGFRPVFRMRGGGGDGGK